MDIRNELIERFTKYVKFDTKSDENTKITPSTQGQGYFAELLADELEEIGMTDVHVSRYSYVTATLPSNCDVDCPVIGLIAHLDTSPDVSGENVIPVIHNYKGGNLVIDADNGVIVTEDECPELKEYIGDEIITSSGDTLLGADDKAGIAEIMTAMKYLIDHPEIIHGKIRVCFTPDEEIGEGADHFDVAKFGSDFAYTIDGGSKGEIEFENFNAAKVKVFITGHNIHPGYAKGKMINASTVAQDFIQFMMKDGTPETTEDYEGFSHLTSMEGTVEQAVLNYIIRDFDNDGFQRRKCSFEIIAKGLEEKYPGCKASVEITDQYYNMKSQIEKDKRSVERLTKAMERAGIVPKIVPIRGGTDGARLSFMGLPCPNVFAGGINFHSRKEFIPVGSMEAATNVIIEIARI